MPPASTVESAFVVLDRASGPVRGIKREVKGLRTEAERAGDALDRIGGVDEVKRLEAFSKETRELAGGLREVKSEVRQANPSLGAYTQRLRTAHTETKKLTRSTNQLAAALERLNAVDAHPTVHVDGIAEARAEIAALRRELRGVGSAHPTASVGVRRAGSVPATIGGTRTRGGAPSVGGGGLRSVDMGPFSLRPGAGLALYAAGLPIAQSVGGAAGAGAATLAGAGLGAGALGVTSYGVAAAGVGALASVIAPAKQGLKDLTDAQKKYNEAIADYGRKSREAARARWELAQAEAAAPGGARGFVQQRTALAQDWQRLTRPGQSALFGAGAQFLGGVRRRAPFLAGQANRVSRSTARQGGQFGEFMLAPEQMRTVRALTNAFASDLKYAEHTAEHLVTVFSNISRASLPFFHEGAQFVDNWTEKWATSTSDIQATRKQIGSYVDDLRTAGRVAGHAAELVHSLFEPARGPGRGMLQDLDSTLVRWDKWADRNPAKIRSFFSDAVDDTEKLAGFLGVAVEDLHRLADVLGPVVTGFAQLASIGGGAGLLLPTALRMGAGQFINRGGGGGAGGGAGVAPILMGGGGGGGGAAAAAAGVAGASYLASRAGGVAGRYSTGSYVARPEGFNARYGGVAGARYAMPTSQLGARQYGLSRAGAAASRGVGAAARFGAPVALITAGIGAATAQGPWQERVSSGLSGATLGAFPVIRGLGSQQSKGQEQALGFLQNLSGDPAANIGRIQKEIASQQGDLGNTVDSWFGRMTYDSSHRDKGEVEQQIKTLQSALSQEAEAQRAQAKVRRRELGQQSEVHGAQLSDSLQRGFMASTTRGPKANRLGADQAMDQTLHSTFMRMRGMKDEGATVLGESMLGWAADMERANPKLKGSVDDLTQYIKRRWSSLGKHIEVVDGQILAGTRQEWGKISAALSDPAERALEKVSNAFTEIQRQAVGSLMAMGYSRSEANALVKAQERGGKKGFTNTQTGISATKGDTGASRAASPSRAARGASASKSFSPLGTAGPFGDGPGMDLASRAAPSGRVSGQAVSTRGSLMGADSGLMPYAQLGAEYGNRVTSGLRVGSITSSGNLSYHSSGHALDMAGGDMYGLAQALYSRYGSQLEELITPYPQFNLKNGQPFKYDAVIEGQHKDHVHAADVNPPAGLADMSFAFSPDTAGPGLMQIALAAPSSGLPGAPGALADAASQLYAAALMQKLGGGPLQGGTPTAGGGSSNVVSAFQQAAMAMNASPLERLALFEAGIVESGLKNLNYGDRDSVGALQQRASQGWTGLMDPYKAAVEFLQHAMAKRPWGGTAGQLAQAVQGSAFPARYDQVAAQAQQYLGDGLGKLRSKLKLAGDGGGMPVAAGGSTMVQFTAHVHTGMDRSALRAEFSKFADQVYDEIKTGAEKRPRAMA